MIKVHMRGMQYNQRTYIAAFAVMSPVSMCIDSNAQNIAKLTGSRTKYVLAHFGRLSCLLLLLQNLVTSSGSVTTSTA